MYQKATVRKRKIIFYVWEKPQKPQLPQLGVTQARVPPNARKGGRKVTDLGENVEKIRKNGAILTKNHKNHSYHSWFKSF